MRLFIILIITLTFFSCQSIEHNLEDSYYEFRSDFLESTLEIRSNYDTFYDKEYASKVDDSFFLNLRILGKYKNDILPHTFNLFQALSECEVKVNSPQFYRYRLYTGDSWLSWKEGYIIYSKEEVDFNDLYNGNYSSLVSVKELEDNWYAVIVNKSVD